MELCQMRFYFLRRISLLFLLFCAAPALADTIRLPIRGRAGEFPATDLVDSRGRLIDVSTLIAKSARGEDLDLLEPQGQDRLWRNEKFSNNNRAEISYPRGEKPEVLFDSTEASVPFTYGALVKDQSGRVFRLRLSRMTHWVLTRVALFRKLGYFTPSPKFYGASNQEDGLLRLKFRTQAAKQEFLAALEDSLGLGTDSYLDWILGSHNPNELTLTLTNATLEPRQSDYFDFHWGYLYDPDYFATAGILGDLQHRRTFRAMILPMVLTEEQPQASVEVDESQIDQADPSQLATQMSLGTFNQSGLQPERFGESVNRFTPTPGRIVQNEVILNLRSAAAFEGATTYHDVRWILRRLLDLTEEDFNEVVTEGFWPEPLRELIKVKLLARTHHIAELFNLSSPKHLPTPNLRTVQAPPTVINGKVTVEKIEGYPQRFSHGDPPSPFTAKDLGRFLSIQAVSSLIQRLLEEVNSSLEIQGVQDVALDRMKTITERINDQIANRPDEILTQKLEAWGGPIGNLFVGANREITTGTYYESTAPIQLVDSLHVGATAGFFGAVDGLANLHPRWATFFLGFGANTTINRSFIHVRPLDSLKEGVKYPWRKLMIPFLKSDLRDMLKEEDGLRLFMTELKVGEVFTVTDSLALGGFANLSTPIDLLMGLSSFGVLNSLSLGADIQRVFVLSQTSFTRTEKGLQIIRRTSDSLNQGLQFDATAYINLLRLRFEKQMTDIHSEAYLIDYDSQSNRVTRHRRPPNADLTQTSEKQLVKALSAVMGNNSDEFLKQYFSLHKLELQHELETQRQSIDLFFRKVRQFEESHSLSLRYPKNPYARADQTANQTLDDSLIQLLAFRKGRLWGNDFLQFLAQLFNAAIERPGLVRFSSSDNPANSPFGEAYWKTIQAEQDLSSFDPLNPVVSLTETWGGWKLRRAGLERILRQLNQKLDGASLRSHRILPEELFSQSETLEFYRINARLLIREEGLNKLRQLFSQQLRGGALPRSDRDYRSTDRAFFSQFTRHFFGGERQFYDACQKVKRHTDPHVHENYHRADESGYRGTYVYGSYYHCMNSWMENLLKLRREVSPHSPEQETEWVTQVLWVLSDRFKLSQIVDFLGEENYLFYVSVTGFRSGDEDGDRTLISHTSGEPGFDFREWQGIFGYYAEKTGLTQTELERTQGGLQ